MSRLSRLTAAAVFLSAVSLATAQTAIPYWEGNQTTINVCVTPYTPMVSCTNTSDPSLYSGYEVELAKRVFAIIGWRPSMLTWKCLGWTDMTSHLEAGDGVCNIAASGVMVDTDKIDKGLLFSWPTYTNGLGVAIINNQQTASIWAFAGRLLGYTFGCGHECRLTHKKRTNAIIDQAHSIYRCACCSRRCL